MEQIAIAVDQLANTLIYIKGDGFGYADETISARSWRLRAQSNFYKFVNLLFFWQENHCKQAYESELNKLQLPKEYR